MVEVSVFFFVKVILDLHVNIHGDGDARAGGGQGKKKAWAIQIQLRSIPKLNPAIAGIPSVVSCHHAHALVIVLPNTNHYHVPSSMQ
jgi:hypothetical protein